MKLPKEERPPREGLRFLARATGSLVLIVLLTAGATATASLLQIKEIIKPPKSAPPPVKTAKGTLEDAKPGKPQTILILGSDRRWSDLKKNNPALAKSNPARSDTILLVRMDPKQEATAVLSIPRDLKVLIPGYGVNKINAAYSLGGPDLTANTIKSLFGEDFKINHIINVNFSGFRQVVDALGCIYADVDRRYYHSNLGLPVSAHYAEIDVKPGYQQLCGQRALDYVRFRHADSDIVRAARQQDFLRAAKDQLSTSSLIDDRDQLIKIMQKSTQTDESLRSVKGVLKLAKLAIFSAGHPVAQIKFPPVYSGDAETGEYVEASENTLLSLRNQFFHASPEVKKSKSSKKTTKASKKKAEKAGNARVANARLVKSTHVGEDLVARTVASHRLGFRLYFPAQLTPNGRYASTVNDGTTSSATPRVYTLRDRAGRKHRAYRLVVLENLSEGSYYGVEGTSWMTPPLLAHPTSTLTVHGRKLELFKSGSRLRYVAWKRKDAVYWVSNSLTLNLSNAQMLGIAASLTHLGS
ncbi:Polyisoprenyl-teichoic acid--peptidoglycan teichoic acid transferase TagU [Baekduia alba]|uniref:LCP family protein n=1 Tax=Baekduia alba TaxID=2997333 RepID=UPI00234191E1|nr:LCP family protein [Baekduia alba]WCB92760.1 Polyisoprenyl-teichoic acid--peptidoglycan teichoic acid transferase TagU [Baekduia alba]